MSRLIAIACLGLLTASAHAGNLRAGLREVQVTRQRVDGQDTRAQVADMQRQMRQQLAGLPPAQRRRLETMMGKQIMGIIENGTSRLCISQDMADRDLPVADPDGSGTPTVTDRGDTMRFEFDCRIQGRRTAGSGETRLSGDALVSRIEAKINDASGVHTIENESRMTCLGADCGGIAPVGTTAR